MHAADIQIHRNLHLTKYVDVFQCEVKDSISLTLIILQESRPQFFKSHNAVNEESIDDGTPSSSSPLYPNSKLNENEAELLILGFIARSKLSQGASQQLLQLINWFLPKNEALSTNLSHIKKKIPSQDTITSTHFYCSKCEEYLDEPTSANEILCQNCNSSFSQSDLMKSGSYFFYFDIKRQIEALLQIPECERQVILQFGWKGNIRKWNGIEGRHRRSDVQKAGAHRV